MTEWYISHQSALEFWRKSFAEDAIAGKRLPACRMPGKPADAQEFRTDTPARLSSPLHVLVGSSNARKATCSLECHIDSRRYPDGSFIQTSAGFNVSSPELCFLQMASTLSLIELIMLGFELCGGYRLEDESESIRGFRGDLPLTNVASLCAFASELPGLKGRKNASRALQFVIDGSASPMETALAMLLTLPYRLGGYGFPKPMMNAPIDIRSGSKDRIRKSRRYCDLYWPDEQVDVEYDSDAYHAYSEQIYKDATRRNTLSSVGVTVVTVSRRQVASTAELRKTAQVLSKLLEKRLQCPMPQFAQRHAELRSLVLPQASRSNM